MSVTDRDLAGGELADVDITSTDALRALWLPVDRLGPLAGIGAGLPLRARGVPGVLGGDPL